MPTYEYKCFACEHAFERFQSIKAEPIKRCPECGKMKVRRLLGTGAGLIFKGSGFYITDYRSEGYKKAAKADGGEGSGAGEGKSSAGEGNGQVKSESKSAGAGASETKPTAGASGGGPVGGSSGSGSSASGGSSAGSKKK